MANVKDTDLPEKTSDFSGADYMTGVDVSNTSDDPAGSSFKVRWDSYLAWLATQNIEFSGFVSFAGAGFENRYLRTDIDGLVLGVTSIPFSDVTGVQGLPLSALNALAQTNAIETTTIFTATLAGMYRVDIYGSVPAGGVGNRHVTAQTIIHTEDGLARTKSAGAGVNTNSANNYSTIDLLVYCDAGTIISYSNTLTGATGSYNVRIGIAKLW